MAVWYCTAWPFPGRQLKSQTLMVNTPNTTHRTSHLLFNSLQLSSTHSKSWAVTHSGSRPPTQSKPSFQLGAPFQVHLPFLTPTLHSSRQWFGFREIKNEELVPQPSALGMAPQDAFLILPCTMQRQCSWSTPTVPSSLLSLRHYLQGMLILKWWCLPEQLWEGFFFSG